MQMSEFPTKEREYVKGQGPKERREAQTVENAQRKKGGKARQKGRTQEPVTWLTTHPNHGCRIRPHPQVESLAQRDSERLYTGGCLKTAVFAPAKLRFSNRTQFS